MPVEDVEPQFGHEGEDPLDGGHALEMPGTVEHESPVGEAGGILDPAAGQDRPPEPPGHGGTEILYEGTRPVGHPRRVAARDGDAP